MNYRDFGKTGWKASALGFGAMRLPTGKSHEDVDEAESVRMIRRAIDGGVNYVDTAWGYHGGKSEVVVGKALKDGYRSKVKLATKLPIWLVKKADDFDKYLDEQLERLGTDTIDLYLIHALNAQHWDTTKSLKLFSRAERAIAEGRIGLLGFSFHDELPVFKEIVDSYDGWGFCQIQYNYMGESAQAGTAGLVHAASKGLAVVVMEPLLGGLLSKAPESIRLIWDEASVRRTPTEWALQWLWDRPEVGVVLSGMSTMAHVEENLIAAGRSRVGLLSAREKDLVRRVALAYGELRPIPCTSCGYCMPCPSGVDIPRNLNIYNSAVMYENFPSLRGEYRDWVPDDRKASVCTACLECEEKCPQKIVVHEWMERIAKEMA
jgi:predicted aldo/keto reductase-like oxidoreductase